MRTIILLLVSAFASITAYAQETKFNDHTIEINNDRNVPKIVRLVSPVYNLEGTPSEIVGKAQGCVVRNLNNNEVSTSGSSASGFFGAIAGEGHNVNNSVTGGSVLELSDPANGILIANSRADYRFMLLAYSVRSRFTIEAKESRFRIVQSNLESLQRSTGNMPNSGYSIVIQRRGTGWDKALTAAINVEKQVVDCMSNTSSKDW